MKKATISLPQKKWGGLVTKYPPASSLVSPDELVAGSVNGDTALRGVLTKRPGATQFGTVSTSIQDTFEAVFVDGTHHLLVMDAGTLKFSAGSTTFSTVKSGYSAAANMEFGIYQDRVYFCNGVSAPQVYDRTVGYGGAFSLPVTLTVVDYTALSADTVTVGLTTVTEGVEWTAAVDNSTTATSLAAALDAISGVDAVAVGAIITVTSETPHIVRLSDAVNLSMASVQGPRIKAAGAQPPVSALSGAEGAAGAIAAGTYTYKVTFVYYDTTESNGGTASGSVVVGANKQVDLTNIPLGGYGVSARKIYRDDGTTGYRLVLTIENNTATTGTDNAAVGTSFIPEDNGTPPQFRYIVFHLDRAWYGGIDGQSSDVLHSEPGTPDIVVSTGFIPCNQGDPVRGLKLYQDRVNVFNRGTFGQILGETSDTFRYSPVDGTSGCIDNRTIQVRTLNGIPTLMWLGDGKFFRYNGSAVDYISDAIEPSVSANIQQADFTRNVNTDSEAADFLAGTASPAIVLNDPVGSITVPNPKEVYDNQTAWETASDFTNLVTKETAFQTPARIGTPLRRVYSYVADQSAATGAIVVAPATLMLTIAADWTGETAVEAAGSFLTSTVDPEFVEMAQSFSVPRNGTINNVTQYILQGLFAGSPPTGADVTLFLDADSGGVPGANIFTSATTSLVGASINTSVTTAVNTALTGETIYWLRVRVMPKGGPSVVAGVVMPGNSNQFRTNTNAIFRNNGVGGWSSISPFPGSTPAPLKIDYTFTQTAVASIGGGYTTIGTNEGFLSDATNQTVYVSNGGAIYPAGTSSVTYIDTSDTVDFSAGVTTDFIANLNGAGTVSLPRRQYWRTRVELAATDDRVTPTINQLVVGWGQAAIWTSPTIDHTTDITALNTLDVTASLPAGASGTVTIEKSLDDITYADEGTFALANGVQAISLASVTNPTRRYTKVRFNLLSDANTATVSAQVSSATLKWTTVSTFVSASIDTGATPAGWDLFNTETDANGGTVAYSMKSAAAEGGLGAASFTGVTTGSFPVGVPLLQWAQWRAIITATADNVPQIDSVTVAWFNGTGVAPVRAASLFHNNAYYVALAETGETANNIILVYDMRGAWHQYTGLRVATMCFFFGRPYIGLALTPTIAQWFTGQTDLGANITLDFRTKALDFDTSDKLKLLRSIAVLVENTGATWTFTYSLDEGTTFFPLVDQDSAASFTTASSGPVRLRRLVPQWPNEISGRTVLIRGVSSDANYAAFYELQVNAFVREGEADVI